MFKCKNCFILKKDASAGNRTRAARVAGEHSTTEPPMLIDVRFCVVYIFYPTCKDILYFIMFDRPMIDR